MVVDATDRSGHPLGSRRVFIEGTGYPLQAQIAIPVEQLNVDARGRRVTLPLTMEQLRRLPRYDPNTRKSVKP
jgi:hypothetical protein